MGAMAVYVYVSQFYNGEADPFPSEEKIASYYRAAPNTVSKYLEELAAWGLIVINPATVGRCNSYSLPYHTASVAKYEEQQIELRKKLINKNWVKGR